jgi:CBS-domain-containing membrane protein
MMAHRAAAVPVADVMTHQPVSVPLGATVGDVMALFDRHDFNAFPVIDTGAVVHGIVTKLDLLRAFRPDPSFQVSDVARLSAGRVEDIMRRGVVTVAPGDPAFRAADLMVETRLHSLPVVEHKGVGPVLVGIVSQADLLRALRGAPVG